MGTIKVNVSHLEKAEMVVSIFEALESVKKYRPIYLALLKNCKTKQEAIDALKYIIDTGIL